MSGAIAVEGLLGPGTHSGRSMQEYLAHPALSASQLLEFHRAPTPAHYHALRGPVGDESTKSQSTGSAAHDLILEPATFEARNVKEPTLPLGYANPRGTKAYKEAVEAIAHEHPGCRVLTSEQWDGAHTMRDHVRAHPAARRILDAEGPVEAIVIWDDPASGHQLRIRPDKLAVMRDHEGELGTCANLKTTRAGDLDGFQREIETWGYAFKAAFYRHVLQGIGFPWSDDVCITVENFSPYLAACRGIHPNWIDMEEDAVRGALRRLAECQASGRWPAYPPEIEYVNAPAWRLRQMEVLA